jgi:hypothetical protein
LRPYDQNYEYYKVQNSSKVANSFEPYQAKPIYPKTPNDLGSIPRANSRELIDHHQRYGGGVQGTLEQGRLESQRLQMEQMRMNNHAKRISIPPSAAYAAGVGEANVGKQPRPFI